MASNGLITRRRVAFAVLGLAAATILVVVAPADATPQQGALDAALVARGDSIYHGKLGGTICATCHGQDAKGVPGLGPDLTDGVWLHGDGGLPFLRTIIRTGVMRPKKSASVMPPFGGIPLDSAQVDAVATYLYSLRPASTRP